MIDSLKFKLKKLWYKRNQYHRKRNPASETDILVCNICKRIMKLKDSDLFVSPVSGDRYVKNEGKGIDISIKDNTVQIYNHTFGYMITVNRFILRDIEKYHNRILESRKRVLEINRGNNVNVSLAKLLEGLPE